MKSLVFLCLLPTVFGGYLETLAASAAAADGRVRSEPERFEGMVAFHCGLPALHRARDGSWVRDIYQDCVNTDEEVKRYCQRVYPGVEIVNVERSPTELRMQQWCAFDKETCPKAPVVTVRPVHCLDPTFQSDALLVPTGCTFGHMVPGLSSPVVAKAGSCKSQDAWNATASQECKRRFPGFVLRRFGALVPCQKDPQHKIGLFRGVEFVCCPKSQAAQPPQLVKVSDKTFDPNAVPKAPKPPVAKAPVQMAPMTSQNRDRYLDYLNREQDPDESEHDRYMDAKDALRKKMLQQEDSIVKSFIEAEHDLDGMWKVDKEGAASLEKNVIQRFRTVFSALLDEEMSELRQMDRIHQHRVLPKLHEKSDRARKMLEYAGQEADPQLSRIVQAAFAYLRSVMKEKVHTINHHSHLMDTDPAQAKEQLPQLRSYLHKLHEEMKQEIDRIAKQAPKLNKKFKQRVAQFLRTYSEVEASAQSLETSGKISATPLKGQSRKDLEMEHMESVINAYRHNGQKVAPAAPKKATPPKKAAVVQKKLKEEQQKFNEEHKKFVEDQKVIHVLPVPGEEEEEALADAEVHEQKKLLDAHRPVWYHAKALENSQDVEHAHNDDGGHEGHSHDRKGRVERSVGLTWLVIGCVAAAALVAAVSALLVLRRRYAGYTPAPACVAAGPVAEIAAGKAVAGEALSGADLAAMQTNGYENPTYKFFELRGKTEEVSEA